MPPPQTVRLGPITRAMISSASWSIDSDFPASQNWADEIERVLSFLEAQSVLDFFMPRLTAREWRGAIAEARAGFFFHRNGFHIVKWQPEEIPNHPGDIEIQWLSTLPIFVEVKGPTWEGELSPDELATGRQHDVKYIDAEARSVEPIGRVIYAMDKALPKLNPVRCNLVVIVDDLFVSPTELPLGILEPSITHEISLHRFKSISGILLINPVCYGGPVEYRKFFVVNPNAKTALPSAVTAGFIEGNKDPQGPRWLRELRSGL